MMKESNKMGRADVGAVDAEIPTDGPDSPPSLLLSPFYLLPKTPCPALVLSLSLTRLPDMLLGKRQRPPIRRTTSMSELVADLELLEEPPRPSDRQIPVIVPVHQQFLVARQTWVEGNSTAEWRPKSAAPVASMVSPRPPRRNSGDFTVLETAPFLRSCGLCNRRLAPGRDIFMYRGEIAFCSLECRQQQMNHDEKKEKCSIPSMKDSTPVTTGPSDPSGTGETVAAA